MNDPMDREQTPQTLMEEILAEVGNVAPTNCQTGKILEQLNDRDRESLITLLANPDIKGPKIVVVLQRRGFEITRSNLQRHRRGECKCGKVYT